MSLTPGVHSLPEKVLKDQQMNMPHLRFANSFRRFCMSMGSAALSSVAAMTIPTTNTVTDRFMEVPLQIGQRTVEHRPSASFSSGSSAGTCRPRRDRLRCRQLARRRTDRRPNSFRRMWVAHRSSPAAIAVPRVAAPGKGDGRRSARPAGPSRRIRRTTHHRSCEISCRRWDRLGIGCRAAQSAPA